MPIYQFNCTDCENQFEKYVRKISSEATETCPECGQEATRGVETPATFVWGKGGGWS